MEVKKLFESVSRWLRVVVGPGRRDADYATQALLSGGRTLYLRSPCHDADTLSVRVREGVIDVLCPVCDLLFMQVTVDDTGPILDTKCAVGGFGCMDHDRPPDRGH